MLTHSKHTWDWTLLNFLLANSYSFSGTYIVKQSSLKAYIPSLLCMHQDVCVNWLLALVLIKVLTVNMQTNHKHAS